MRAHAIRVYADTSVFDGVFDEEFRTASELFFAQVRSGRFQLVTSAIVQEEISPVYNAVNTLRGYAHIGIFSPLEVIQYEDEDI